MLLGVIVQQTTANRPSTFQEIADGVIVLMIGGIGAWLGGKFKIVEDIRDAFGTRPATEFEPARLGILDQMKAVTDAAKEAVDATHQLTTETAKNSEAVLAMGVRVGQATDSIETVHTEVRSLAAVVDAHGESLDTLVHESKTNEGGSMRDAVDAQGVAIGEMQTEQARVRDEKHADDDAKRLDSD